MYHELERLRVVLEHQKNILENHSIPNYLMVSADSRIFSNLVVQISEVAVDAEKKFQKYFHQELGFYPGLMFLKNVSSFNPEKCLAINHPINLSITGIEELPSGELILYREKAQEFEPRDATSTSRIYSLEQHLIDIKNFWICNKDVLPNLCKLAISYAFLCFSSAEVERRFSRSNTLSSSERRRMSQQTTNMLLFVYFNLYAKLD